MSTDITAHAATILGAMQAERALRTRDEIRRDLPTPLGYSVFVRTVRALIADGLVDIARASVPNQRISALLQINDAGVAALRMHKRRQKEALRQADKSRVAPPRRINLFALPPLETQCGGYVRNDGNKHIASRGMGC